MFVDNVEITISSGNGGAGAVSFRKEKFILHGGPDGGDGGKGGDVYFLSDKNTSTLAKFKGNKNYFATNGQNGEKRNRHGKKGLDIVIKVPPGTQIIDVSNDKILLDLTKDGQKVKILSGGKGGMGNARFKNSINQRPTYSQPGEKGTQLIIRLELKLIADIAIVGFPNSGKSSLIAKITNSKPKIANYEFSTLIPNLGVIDIDEFNSFVIADIPGLIEGSSEGKGLGLQFLRHIERTKMLLFMLDCSRDFNNNSNEDTILKQLTTLQKELKQYSEYLYKKLYCIAISKSDILTQDKLEKFKFKNQNSNIFDTAAYVSPTLTNIIDKNYSKVSNDLLNNEKDSDISPLFILPISSTNNINIKALKFLLFHSLQLINSKEQ